MNLQANSFLCHISVAIMLYFTKEGKDFLCATDVNFGRIQAVLLTLPMKYYLLCQ